MILYVSKRFENNVGARIHYHIIQELFGEDQVHTVDLRPEKSYQMQRYLAVGKYKNKADRITRWLQGNTMFLSDAIIKKIGNIVQENQIKQVFIEDSFFGNLVKYLKMRFPDIIITAFYHDIGADLFSQWNKNGGILQKIEGRLSIRQEKITQAWADHNVVFNTRDADLYESYYHKRPQAIIPISVEIPYAVGQGVSDSNRKELLFVGTKYYPNIIGIRWFYQQVLPHLSDGISVKVVGRGMEILREEFTDPRVHVIGEVDDLSEYYRQADIVIAPLFDGGGMKSKTVEAVSFGKCFIGTRESLFGFWEEMGDSLRNRIVYNCNSVQEWVDVINGLVYAQIERFNPNLYELFLEKYSYDATKKMLARLLGCKR